MFMGSFDLSEESGLRLPYVVSGVLGGVRLF